MPERSSAGRAPVLYRVVEGSIPSVPIGRRTIVNRGRLMNDKEVKAFYNSSAWKHKRIEILERDRYECQDCRKRLKKAAEHGEQLAGRDRLIRRAEEVHHVRELKEHPELALDNDNLISLCTQCHNIRHGRHPQRFVKRKKRLTEEKW